MDGIGYYTGILTSDSDDHITGLEDLTFPTIPQTQANTYDIPLESQDDVVELQATKVVPRRHGGQSHRSKKFDKEEDKVICAAWLQVSKDPIHGANQRLSTFWGRVHAFFDANKKTDSARTENSLMHRWMTIQKEVNKFCSAYEKIERRNASGKTIQDMVHFHSWFFFYLFNIWLILHI